MLTSLFTGMNNAVRAMQRAQTALTVHGSNIANANEPTYTLREMLPPSEVAVNGPGVVRLRDQFIDDQFRQASGQLGDAEIRRNVLSKVEDIFGDPVGGGLRQAIDQFFDAWKGLSESPSDGVSRLQVLSAGRGFAQQIQNAYRSLSAMEQTTNEQLPTRVQALNTALTTIFDLNVRISELHRNNMDDADLRDQRDKVLDTLAKLAGAQGIEQPDGTVRVIIGSTGVVDGPTVAQLKLVSSPDGPVPTWDGYANPTFGGTGTIAGLVAVRDGAIKQLKADIDNLGRTVATEVNAIHNRTDANGNPGQDFFLLSAAPADLTVNPAVGAAQVAADLGTGLPSDGENARKLAAVGESAILESVIIPGQLQPPRTYYRNLVGWLGSQAQAASQLEEIAKTHVRIGDQQRQSEWGVSLDEEVAKLSMEQKAFAASARVINVMDSMLDDLINRMGR